VGEKKIRAGRKGWGKERSREKEWRGRPVGKKELRN
jgi:hypothetical protein